MTKKKRTLIICSVVVAVIATAIFWLFYVSRNYAIDITDKIGSHLVKSGAVKKCDFGDNGRGWDNRQPWVYSYYEIAKSEEESIRIVKDAATAEGFTNLTHASLENKGPIDVADEFIDQWYYDHTSQDSQYHDLATGKVNLEISIREGYPNMGEPCEGQILSSDSNHTIIALHVQLPAFKQ